MSMQQQLSHILQSTLRGWGAVDGRATAVSRSPVSPSGSAPNSVREAAVLLARIGGEGVKTAMKNSG